MIKLSLLLVIKIKSNEFKFKKLPVKLIWKNFQVRLKLISIATLYLFILKLFCVPDWLIWISKRAFT
jgi:hypothetical protein